MRVRHRSFAMALAGLGLLAASPAQAQWELVYQPGGDDLVTTFAATPDRIYAAISRPFGSQDGADVVSSADGETWTRLAAPFPEYAYFVTSLYAKGQTLVAGYAGGGGGTLRSDDGGSTWRLWNEGLPAGPAVNDVDGENGVLFAATQSGVYHARLEDDAWTPHAPGFPASPYGALSLAVRGDLVIAGSFGDGFSYTTGGLFRSTVTGAPWERIESTFAGDNQVTDIDVTSGGIVATGSGVSRAFASADGASWSEVPGLDPLGFPAWITGFNGGAVAVGLDGVLFSADGVSGWTPIGDGLPDGTRLQAVDVYNGEVYVAAFEPAVGVWRRSVAGLVATDEASTSSAFGLGALAPNPARDWTRLPVTLDRAASVTVEVITMDGRVIRTLAPRAYPAGLALIGVDTRGLAAGAYAIRVQTLDQTMTAFVTVMD